MANAAALKHSPSASTPTAPLEGRLLMRELLDGLLDTQLDDSYTLSMQESKTHPLEQERYHMLLVAGKPLWVASPSNRSRGAQLTEQQLTKAKTLAPLAQGSVRSLIHHIVELHPYQTIDLGGHFYSGITLQTYPIGDLTWQRLGGHS